MKTTSALHCNLKAILALAASAAFALTAPAQVLTNESFTISSGAGGSGGAQTSCMIMSDGTSWSGGAVGVQGTNNFNNLGSQYAAADVTFKFNVGSAVSALNTRYGAGNWTIANPQLSFQYTLYANNNRFNAGPGTFDIYWVANDGWVQGTANPVYATNAATLSAWSGGQSLIGSEYYPWITPGYTGTYSDLFTSVWVTDKTGVRQSTNYYSLTLDPSFVGDVTSATAASNPNVSLYLMATDQTLGICIFTGGANYLPTLSFQVVKNSLNITDVVAASNGSLTLGLSGVPGYTYWLEAATNLSNPTWQAISTNVAGTNGVWNVTDTNATCLPQRFYRIRQP